MLKYIAFFILSTGFVQWSFAQTGNHVFSGSEAANFGTVSLSTPGGQTWSTDRSASPGYFSALGAATYTNAADGTAYIDGYVKYYGNNAAAASFTFPTGQNSDLRTLTITAPASTGIYATAWIVGDPSGNLDPTSTGASGGAHSIGNLSSPIVGVSPYGQWDWQDLSGDASGKTITVSIPDMTDFGLQNNLRLVGWDGSHWVDLSGSATASGNTENSTLSGTMQSNISAIGIGSVSQPLPAVFGTISAIYSNGLLRVDWQTLSESNSKEFAVEGSVDGIVWKQLGLIDSKAEDGASATTLNYQFEAAVSGAVIAGMGLLSLLLFVPGSIRRSQKKWLMLAMIGLSFTAACTKKMSDVEAGADLAQSAKYVRIVQFDKDGAKRVSKVVKVVHE
ncbi:hypothetical protein ABDK00_014555 [Niabella insulamsoli]|uniref:hypothetical protein n=1 Tax=Niabella insulamsoli TaxID=3144874 RepID=UPI0031FD812E